MYNAKGSELAVLRFKQIDSLRQYFPTVRELSKDKTYEVPVILPTKHNITIRISLANDFPQSPPALKVIPAVTHRLIDANMNIKSEASSKLSGWHSQQNLGKTMYSIVQKLMQEPPKLGYSAPIARVKPSTNAPKPVASKRSNNSRNDERRVSTPNIPAQFPELNSMKPSQLGELLNDDAAFRAFLNNLESVQNMRSLRDDLRAGQQSSADTNDLDRDIQAAQIEYAKWQSQLSAKVAQQDKVMQKLQVDHLVDALADLAAEVEDETDEMSRDFLDGDIDVKTFQKQFIARRELFHLRSAKKESLLMKKQREGR